VFGWVQIHLSFSSFLSSLCSLLIPLFKKKKKKKKKSPLHNPEDLNHEPRHDKGHCRRHHRTGSRNHRLPRQSTPKKPGRGTWKAKKETLEYDYIIIGGNINGEDVDDIFVVNHADTTANLSS
jgi:hypothetical protein